jgi:hypothetical protein
MARVTPHKGEQHAMKPDFGYIDQPNDRTRRKLAATFTPDPKMDRLVEMQRTDPATFQTLSISTRLSVGHYLEAKQAYEEVNS